MTSFRKTILTILTVTTMFLSGDIICQEISNNAAQAEICVEGIGSGLTKQDALHDAMRKAIAHAVGMYVTTRSEIKDDSYKEKIIITSDATITNYSEIESFEHKGMWMVKIKAKILPNELSKYCPKLVTQKVTSADIGNLLNKRNTLKNVNETIDEIFQNDYYPIIRIKKQGNLQVASEDNLSGDEIKVKVNFVVYIDQKAFNKFQKKLCSLLDKIALQKEECFIASRKRIPEDFGFRLWKRAGLKDSDVRNSDVSFLAFKNYKQNGMKYTLYLVPHKIAALIQQKVKFDNTYIVCSFFLDNESNSLKKFFREYIGIDTIDRSVGEFGFNIVERGFSDFSKKILVSPITFLNCFEFGGRGHCWILDRETWCKRTKGSFQVSIPINHVKHLQEIYIYPLYIKGFRKKEDAANEIEKQLWHRK